MPIRFTCPACKKTLSAPDGKAGVRVACPGCKRPLQVPTLSATRPATGKAGSPAVPKNPMPQAAMKPPPLPTDQRQATVPLVPKKKIGPAVWVGIAVGGVLLLAVLVAVPIMLLAGSGKGGKQQAVAVRDPADSAVRNAGADIHSPPTLPTGLPGAHDLIPGGRPLFSPPTADGPPSGAPGGEGAPSAKPNPSVAAPANGEASGFDPKQLILGRWREGGNNGDTWVFYEGGRFERQTKLPDPQSGVPVPKVIPGKYKFYADQRVAISESNTVLISTGGSSQAVPHYRVHFADGSVEMIIQDYEFDTDILTLHPLDGQRWAKDARRTTAEYVPHEAGSAWTLDHIQFASPVYVARKRYTVGNGGQATVTTTREAFLFPTTYEGRSEAPGDHLPQTGGVRWTQRKEKAGPPLQYRTMGEFIELGHPLVDGGVAWEPVLRVGAGVGDRWEWSPAPGVKGVYEIESFGEEAGQPSVTIRITINQPGPDQVRRVEYVTYVRGKGLVRANGIYYSPKGYRLAEGTVRAGDQADAPEDNAPIKVQAEDFAHEFEANRVKANDRYSGRQVEITGTVKGVQDVSAHPRIALIGGNGDSTTPELSFGSRYKGALGQIKKGEKVTVRGLCTGDAQLHDCSPPGQPDDSPDEYEDQAKQVVSPRKLVTDYFRGNNGAKEHYAGKEFTLVGYVARDHTTSSRQPSILLDAGSDFPYEIHCRLASRPGKPFRVGERVFLHGRCVGFGVDLGPGLGQAPVLFEDCRQVPEFSLDKTP